MRRTTSGLLTLSLLVSLAGSSNAQSPASDQAYCHALVESLRQYNCGVARIKCQPSRGNLGTDVAVSQCQHGNTGPAIPVLEKLLRDRDIALPPRT